jgi:hypothetical protein
MRRRLLMRDIDRVFELRKNMIDDWKNRGLDWKERKIGTRHFGTPKYGVSLF